MLILAENYRRLKHKIFIEEKKKMKLYNIIQNNWSFSVLVLIVGGSSVKSRSHLLVHD